MLKKALLMMTCTLVFSTASYAEMEAGILQDVEDAEIFAISDKDKSAAIDAEGSGVIAKGKASASGSSTGQAKAVTTNINQKCKSTKCKAFIKQKVKGGTVAAIGNASAVTSDINQTDQ